MYSKTCVVCGKVFETNNPRKKYCSKDCYFQVCKKMARDNARIKAKKNLKKISCVVCGKVFESSYSNQIYCSKDCCLQAHRKRCYDNARIKAGKKFSEKKFRKNFSKCFGCGKKFEQSFPNEKFCSDDCRITYFKLNGDEV